MVSNSCVIPLMEPVTLITAIAAGSFTLLARFLQRRSQKEAVEHAAAAEPATLETRLAGLAANMTSASSLLVLVETELEARRVEAERLAGEARNAEEILKLTQEQKDAVAAEWTSRMQSVVQADSSKANRLSVLVGALYFLGGGAVTFLVTLLVHPLT